MARERYGKRTHRRDRVARRFLYVVGGLALLGFFAPTIIGSTPLLNSLLAGALPAEAGKLTAGGASLGWFSPVRLERVQLVDAEGRVVMHADAVLLEKSLLSLATGSSDLGTVTIDRPAVYVFARPDGSNVEDLLAKLNQETGEPEPLGEPSTPRRMTLVVRGAAVAVTDAVTGQTDVHDPIDLTVKLGEGLEALEATGFAHAIALAPGQPLPPLPIATPQNRRGGAFRLALTPAATGANEASVSLTAVNLRALLGPWLRRIDPTMTLDGTASGRGAVSWWPAGADAALERPITSTGQVRIDGFRVAAAALGGDPIQTQVVDIPWRVTAGAGGRIAVEQLGVTSDFAAASLTGDVSREELAAVAAGDWLAPRAARVSADVDLAKLAQISPSVLHLREGVAITSGRAKLDATISPNANGKAINAILNTASIDAVRNGRPIRFEQPIKFVLAASQSPGALRIERLDCESSFLTGSASGDLTGLRGTAELDLDRLVAETQQLFDHGPWRLSGKARGEIELARVDQRGYRAKANSRVDGCVVSYDGRPIVLERKLVIDFGAEGQTDPATGRPVDVATAKLDVNSDDDTLIVTLTEPTPAVFDTLPIDLRLGGDVSAWLRRLRSLMPAGDSESLLGQLQAAGKIDARAAGRFGPERVEVASAEVNATDLKLRTETLAVNEAKAQFRGDVAWDAATGDIASQAGELISSTVALRARSLLVRGQQATGELAVRANLARLGASLPGVLGDRQLAGEVTGGVRLGSSDAAGVVVPTAHVDLVANRFAIAEPGPSGQPTVLWQEPKLAVRGDLSHDSAADRLTLAGLSIQSQDLSGTVGGVVDRLSSSPSPQLTGTVDYDLAKLSLVIASWAGPGVTLAGRHQAEFQVASVDQAPADAPWSRRWTGKVRAPWTSASLYGLPVGQGVLTASLAGGQLRAEPLKFAVGQGSASLQPIVQFDPEPAAWGLPAGQVLTGVRITPQVSEQMLKFIAPVLANAIRSDGTFSLRTEGVRAPLADAQQMETSGQLTIHNLQVTPGPGVAEWVSAGRTVEALIKDRDPTALAARPAPTLLSINQRTVNYQVARGRVYHSNLQFEVDGVPVSSSGSVGFDESLSLVLSIPVQDDWVNRDRRLVGFRGQVIQVPVAGTLGNAKLDRRQFQELSRELLKEGARGAIESELGKALEKLFN